MTLVKHNYRTYGDLFDEFFNQFPAPAGKGLNTPPVNIQETADAYHLDLVAPGLKKEDFKITVEKSLLTIGYEKQPVTDNTEFKTHRREFNMNSFKRSFSVDDKINADAIQAKYEDGILKLVLPKKEVVKPAPKQITID